MSSSHDTQPNSAGLTRRLAALVYEALLLFGVLMPAAWLYASVTQQRHALQGRAGLQAFLFLVLGAYFIWFWTHGGQTLALKTWRLKIVARNGQCMTPSRALARYLLCWLWFLPSLLTIHLAGLSGAGPITALVLAGMFVYASCTYVTPQRQFLHDTLCGTRIVEALPTPPKV